MLITMLHQWTDSLPVCVFPAANNMQPAYHYSQPSLLSALYGFACLLCLAWSCLLPYTTCSFAFACCLALCVCLQCCEPIAGCRWWFIHCARYNRDAAASQQGPARVKNPRIKNIWRTWNACKWWMNGETIKKNYVNVSSYCFFY